MTTPSFILRSVRLIAAGFKVATDMQASWKRGYKTFVEFAEHGSDSSADYNSFLYWAQTNFYSANMVRTVRRTILRFFTELKRTFVRRNGSDSSMNYTSFLTWAQTNFCSPKWFRQFDELYFFSYLSSDELLFAEMVQTVRWTVRRS